MDEDFAIGDEDVQQAYTNAPAFEFSGASVMGGIDEEGHMRADDLFGVQV
jgi:hypothetical protein